MVDDSTELEKAQKEIIELKRELFLLNDAFHRRLADSQRDIMQIVRELTKDCESLRREVKHYKKQYNAIFHDDSEDE